MSKTDEEIKSELLKLVSSVEVSLPRLKDAIEQGLLNLSPNTFYTRFMGTLPGGAILDTVTMTIETGRSVTFSFLRP